MIAAYLHFGSAATTAPDVTPVPSFFNFDWADVGGWSLFIGLCLFITVGAVREWWVPGRTHRRLQTSSDLQSKTLATTVDALREQTQANEITKHFFEKTVPTRGEPHA